MVSSNVVSIGHADDVLEVEFKSGVYRYMNVPRDIFDQLMASNSKGQFINQHIKEKFLYHKV